MIGILLYVLYNVEYVCNTLIADNIDNSGIRFTLTRTPRQFNASLAGIGSQVNTNLFVPPNTNQFNIYGYCPSTCTNNVRKLEKGS